jgi:hypothetical protein
VLYCFQCSPERVLPSSSKITPNSSYSWCLSLQCWKCGSQWNICQECSGARKHFITSKQLYDHHRLCHRSSYDIPVLAKTQRITTETAEVLEDILEDYTFPMINDDNSTVINQNYSAVVNKGLDTLPTSETFHDVYNKCCFSMQHHGNSGAKCLVSLFNVGFSKSAQQILPEEVSMHLNICRLLCNLKRSQQGQLSKNFHQISHNALHQYQYSTSKELTDSHRLTKIPVEMLDFRDLHLHGKHAMIPNLPRPAVSIIGDHAYISLKDCVANLLGHSFLLDDINDDAVPETVTKISDSFAAKKIYSKMRTSHHCADNMLCFYITKWSDAFEPSISVKSNQGSCWIKTVTIFPLSRQLHDFPYIPNRHWS